MSDFYRSIEYIATKMNKAKDTKQSIINAASSYEHVQNKVEELEQKAWMGLFNQEPVQKLDFNPNEIESIVLKNKPFDNL